MYGRQNMKALIQLCCILWILSFTFKTIITIYSCMRMGSLDRSKVEQTVWKRCNVFIAAVLCTVYQNMESGIVLYTLETIASIRSLCITPHYVLLFHLKFEITDANGLFTPTTFHTSLMFKRDSKTIFLNKSCSLSSSSTTDSTEWGTRPQHYELHPSASALYPHTHRPLSVQLLPRSWVFQSKK